MLDKVQDPDKEKTIKYFSMFSGIGGFEYGIEKADTETRFECVGYSEIDKYAVSIYEKHYPNHTNYGDATRIDTKDLPDFSFLVGGFPCQAFSLAGKRKGFEDTRGTLFFEIARVLQEKRPRYFLLENVRGLLSHDKGKTFQVILGVLADLGYNVQWTVLNSKDYGVPQNRERIFIKGYLRGECGLEVLSLPRTGRKTDEKLSQINGGLYKISEDKYATTTKKGDFFAVTTRQRGRPFHKKQDNYIIEVGNDTFTKVSEDMSVTTTKEGNCFCLTQTRPFRPLNKRLTNYVKEPLKIATATKKGYDEAFPHDGVRLDHPDGSTGRGRVQKNLAGTLTCGGNLGTVNQDFLIRRLTPVECERLQGFPDNWTKYGKDGELISDTQRYKCCGNAVTTNVIAAIIEEMFP